MKRYIVLVLTAFAICFVGVPGASPDAVGAQETTTLRMATLATQGSPWHRAFRAWSGSVEEESEGRLRLQFYYGGSQGDESDYISKMESGQLDGAAMTNSGLGSIARPVLVLSAPGVLTEYAQLDRARRRLNSQFERIFDEAGYAYIGEGEVGRARFFSNRAIRRPQDLRQTRPWARPEDSIVTTFYEVVGASPQRMGVNALLPGLQTGRVNAFPSTALATVSLQWHNHATFVTQQSNSFVVGATVIKKEKYDALPEDLRTILDDTATRAHRLLTRSIRRQDDRAYEALVSRGMTAVDLTPNQAAWDDAARQTRTRLAGRLYSAALLRQVEAIAAAN